MISFLSVVVIHLEYHFMHILFIHYCITIISYFILAHIHILFMTLQKLLFLLNRIFPFLDTSWLCLWVSLIIGLLLASI